MPAWELSIISDMTFPLPSHRLHLCCKEKHLEYPRVNGRILHLFVPFVFFLTPTMSLASDQTPYNFPDFEDQIDPAYKGETFVLRQDYPNTLPDAARPWERINFKTDPKAYLESIKSYLFLGMEEANWRPGQNKKVNWYHMPWVTQGRRAREGIRGLNRNADIPAFRLAKTQTAPQQKWELSFYNDIAAYQIGQIWKTGEPDLTQTEFPEGSVIGKFIFITGDDAQFPFMQGAPEVTANIHASIDRNSPKKARTVRLIQMDFSIRDARADDTTSWVMGTYVYDKNAVSGRHGTWDKMVPVGVQWGNDPDIPPSVLIQGITLKETVIMEQVPSYARATLGYGGRLNGPADLAGHSCLGCHSMAQWPNPLNKKPKGRTEKEKMRYFRNLKPDEPFQAGHISLDYQLHLENSFRAYFAALKKTNANKP